MRMLRKMRRYLNILGAIFYLLYSRLKNIGKPKGIAQVVESFNSGGLEQVATNIYKAFKENGNTSSVIVLSNNLGPMCNQLESPRDLRIIYYDLAAMIKYCAKYNINTLVFHFTTYHMIFLKLLGFKNYYIIHNTYIWYTNKEWKHLKFKLHFVNNVIAVSDWCKEYFIKRIGYKKDIKVILNGIDFNNLNDGEICKTTRKSLKIKDNEVVCLTIGGYTPGKHQMAIIGIAEEVIKINKNVKFITAGPIQDQKLYNNFIKNVKKSKAKKNIIVLNYIPQEEIGDFINKVCDIYLQPSIHEAGVPLTVMEALRMGKPVVMTDFMVNQTFPNSERITGVTLSYKDILKLTVKDVDLMCKKAVDKSTKEFAQKIIEVTSKLDYFNQNFNQKDYDFLSSKRMAREYIDYIKL